MTTKGVGEVSLQCHGHSPCQDLPFDFDLTASVDGVALRPEKEQIQGDDDQIEMRENVDSV